MSASERQLSEDRAMRDAARRLFKADLALVRDDLATRGPGARASDRISDAALDTFDEAVGFAAENRGKVAGVLGLIALWFLRGPILDGLGALTGANDDDDARDDRQDEDARAGH